MKLVWRRRSGGFLEVAADEHEQRPAERQDRTDRDRNEERR